MIFHTSIPLRLENVIHKKNSLKNLLLTIVSTAIPDNLILQKHKDNYRINVLPKTSL